MNGENLSNEDLYHEAEQIFHKIQESKLELADGEQGWISYDLTSHDSTDAELVLEAQKGIYSGQLGIALYFAAMYNVFQDNIYRESAKSSVEFLLEGNIGKLTNDIGNGAGNGLGSVIYGLSVLSDLTGERKYSERARQFARVLTEERIRDDEEYDVLVGTAGAVIGLLRLYECSNDSMVLERATTCGEHLIDSRLDKWGYQVWDTFWEEDMKSFSTGMSHGAAGIGYSLYRLYAHTQREEFCDAANDAVRFENVFYSEYRNNWRANWTALPHYPHWWCYGAPGIGLARLGSLNFHDSDMLQRDLDRVKCFEPRLGDRDSICHGTFSQVELMIELEKQFDEDYGMSARNLTTEAVRRKRRTGGYNVVCGKKEEMVNPSLFLGLAGIGYTFLRLAHPNEIPSILMFE